MKRSQNRVARAAEFHDPGTNATFVFNGSPGAPVPAWRQILVASWSGSGPYTYELVHGNGYETVLVVLYDAVANVILNESQYKAAPKTGSETSTLVISLPNDPGADRIKIGYLSV